MFLFVFERSALMNAFPSLPTVADLYDRSLDKAFRVKLARRWLAEHPLQRHLAWMPGRSRCPGDRHGRSPAQAAAASPTGLAWNGTNPGNASIRAAPT